MSSSVPPDSQQSSSTNPITTIGQWRLQSLEALRDGRPLPPRPSAKSTSVKVKRVPKPKPLGIVEMVTMKPLSSQVNKANNSESKSLLETLHPKVLTEFTCFPELPIELRIQIWKLAGRASARLVICDKGFRVPVPGVLHACCESREEALKRYELTQPTQGFRSIYVDFSCDVCFYSMDNDVEGFVQTVNCKFLSKVQHLSLTSHIWRSLHGRDFLNPAIIPTPYGIIYNLIQRTIMNSQAVQSITIVWSGEVLGKRAQGARAVEFLPGPRDSVAGFDFDRHFRVKAQCNWKWKGQLLLGSYKRQD